MVCKQKFRFLVALGLSVLMGAAAQAQNYEYSSYYQPNLNQINVTRTLHNNLRTYISRSASAKRVGIAVLDGRADANHTDLRGRITVSQVYAGRYRFNDAHGTHVAGIAGASQNSSGIVGVAPTARIISIPVFDDWGWVAYDLGRAALNRAVSLGARVANMSYGPYGDLFISGELEIFDDYKSSMVLVRAAGNDELSLGHQNYAFDASTSLSHLLIVGSVDGNNGISYFSNTPGSACIGSAGCDESDMMKNFFIVAPGEYVLSDVPGKRYSYMSGTSMAAPHVSGAAALVFQEALAGNQVLTPSQVASILKQSARDLGDVGVDGVYGWGLLDVSAALGPVGGTFIATGSSVNSGLVSTSGSGVSGSSVLGSSRSMERAMDGMVVFDAYKRAFVVSNPKLGDAPSTLLENTLSELKSALTITPAQEIDYGAYKLSLFQSDPTNATASAFSFAGQDHRITAGLGAAKGFFGQADSTAVNSYTLGATYFQGAGDAGTALENAMFVGADYNVAPDLVASALYMHAGPGDADALADKAADFLSLGTRLALSDDVSVGVSYAMLREEGQLLGIHSSGAFSLGDIGMTQLGGIQLQGRIDRRTTISTFAEISSTSSTQASDSLFLAASGWLGSRMGLTVSRQGVLRAGDAVSLSAIKPWQIDDGDISARVAVGRELDGTVNYEVRSASLGGGVVPLDLGVSYSMAAGALGYGASVWLRDDDVHSLGFGEVSVAAALSLKF